MFMGTGSDVGKSLIVAGLCRLLSNRGMRVRPFKPQNMSNNAAVTADGGEIGRAQALQARACRVAPSVHMNPVLLKPQSMIGAQIIVQGRMQGSAKAREFQTIKPTLMPAVLESFARLKAEADIVLVEGAGSASEINLRANDIANMGFARAANVPVVLIGDIDRGGVIASIVGTHTVIDPADAAMIRGFLINRMRGDVSLFADGVAAIARMTGWTSLGIVPYFEDAHKLPAEDALALRDAARWRGMAGLGTRDSGLGSRAVALSTSPESLVPSPGRVRIAVPVLPRIANFDDLDPLRLDPAVDLLLLHNGEPIPPDTDLVILPGSKATIADLADLRAAGWDHDIHAHVRRGGQVLGLCGGYQMLGQTISDPQGIEGTATTVPGLGLLAVDTVLTGAKQLRAVTGQTIADHVPFTGYEMHVGETTGQSASRPLVRFADRRTDGGQSPDGKVAGTYAHGFFADDRQRRAWVSRLGGAAEASAASYEATVEATLDALAEHLAQHLDVEALLKMAKA
jgi:adenosylcobyric acid synthase